MKHFALTTAAVLLAASSLRSAEAPSAQDQQLAAIVKEIHTQQAKMAENQAAIDAKLATVGEALRMARIYVSRGGR